MFFTEMVQAAVDISLTLLRMAHRVQVLGSGGGFFPLEKLDTRPGVWQPRRPGSAGASGHTEPGYESHSFIEDEAPP